MRASRRRPPSPREPSVVAGILIAIAAALGFALGRGSVAEIATPPLPSAPSPTPVACVETALPASAVATSTLALCPCPQPRRPAASPSPRGPRRSVPPVVTADPPPRDPSSKTASYLREAAHGLARCAPLGDPLRVHLEITVQPEGRIAQSRVANLDPIPSEVARCIQSEIQRLTPPPFDGVSAETFGLTIVL